VEIVPMLRMFIHDELVFSVPKADAPEIEAAILNAVQFDWAPYEGMRPIRVLAELGARGKNWAEVYSKG
jgi:DNA polymerase I